MAGALLAVLLIGAVTGLGGRLLMPGRHGLAYVLRRDPKLAPRLLMRDVETRWEVGAGIFGANLGYVLGRFVDAQSPLGPSPARWVLAAFLAMALVVISIVSEIIERGRMTRRSGLHR
jgi:hypothetical protein